MKKEWQQPTLEVLDIKMTMQGPGLRDVDGTFQDEDEIGYLHKS